jgi:hypothetical protein
MKTFWLTREAKTPQKKRAVDCWYEAHVQKPGPNPGHWSEGESMWLEPSVFHKLSAIRLKPGGGPVRATFTTA